MQLDWLLLLVCRIVVFLCFLLGKGAPIGGVLYSLETTASFYIVRTFWKATAATVSGALIYKLLYDTPLVEAFQKTTFDVGVVDPTEIVLFALLGILMGLQLDTNKAPKTEILHF